MSTHSQRGRIAHKKRGGSLGIFYAILAVIAIAGVAMLAIANQRSATSTNNRPTVTTTIPLDTLPARGQASAPLSVVEYADFQCPACGDFANTMEAGIVQDYVDTGKIRLVFHDF